MRNLGTIPEDLLPREPTRLQLVCAALQRMELQFETGRTIADGLIEVELVVKMPDGRSVTLEVDGPYYFTAHQPHRELGRLELRRRLLKAWGHDSVRVPFYEWDALFDRHKNVYDVLRAQQAYLLNVLDAHRYADYTH